MATKIECPNHDCKKPYSVPEEHFGRVVRCAECGQRFRVDAASRTAEAVAPRGSTETEAPPSILEMLAKASPQAATASASFPDLESGIFAEPEELKSPVPHRNPTPSSHPKASGKPPAKAERDKTPIPGVSDPKPKLKLGAPVPTKLGRFEIHEKIGSGAFGAVYRAQDVLLDREVALKIPQAGALDSPKAVDRFMREAKAAAQLRHPNLVPVYDAGKEGEHYFIASAFIHGQTLSHVMDEQPINYVRATRIVIQMAEGLDYAHNQGIIHRDVKPSNVMIDVKGGVHVMDFGLAQFQDSLEKLTQDGTVVGTPAYMAPEQAKGEAIGPTCDQYSLGVALYELLCKERPFSGPPQILLFNAIRQEAPSPRTHDPNVPRDLETICLKALAKSPAHRYGSCKELAEDLQRWLKDEPIKARRMTPIEHSLRWCRRNPALAALTMGVMTTLMAGIVVSTHFAIDRDQRARHAEELAKSIEEQKKLAEQQRAVAEQQKVVAEEQRAEAQKQMQIAEAALAQFKSEKDARQKAEEAAEQALADKAAAQSKLNADAAAYLEIKKANAYYEYAENITLAEREWSSGNLDRTRQLLDECPPEFRGWEWDYLNHMFQPARVYSNELSIRGGPALAISADWKRMAFGQKPGAVRVVRPTTGEDLHTLKFDEVPEHLAFTADGRFLATAGKNKKGNDDEVRIFDAANGQELAMRGGIGASRQLAFARDGSYLAAWFAPREISLWEAPGWEARGTFAGESFLAFSPDNAFLAVGDSGTPGEPVRILSSRALKEREGLSVPRRSFDVRTPMTCEPVLTTAVGKAIKRIAITGHADGVRLWDHLSKSDPIHIPASAVFSLALSADGSLVVAGLDDSRVLGIDVQQAKTRFSFDIKRGRVIGLSLAPDGKRLLVLAQAARELMFAGATELYRKTMNLVIKVWDVGQQQEVAELYSFKGDAGESRQSLSWSPQGTYASASGGLIVKTWRGGHTIEVEEVAEMRSLAYSHDSRILATGGLRGAVRLFRASSGERINGFAATRDKSDVLALAFHPQGHRIAVGGSDGSIQLWDPKSATEDRSFVCAGHVNGKAVVGLAFGVDGDALFSAAADGSVIEWRTASGERRKEYRGDRSGAMVGALALSKSGGQLVAGYDDGTLIGWNPATGERLYSLKAASASIVSLAFSPDGKRIAVAGADQSLAIWDIDREAGKHFQSFTATQEGRAGNIAFSIDGRRLFSLDRLGVAIWDTAEERNLLTLTGHKAETLLLAVRPDGRQAASIDALHRIRLWNSDKPESDASDLPSKTEAAATLAPSPGSTSPANLPR